MSFFFFLEEEITQIAVQCLHLEAFLNRRFGYIKPIQIVEKCVLHLVHRKAHSLGTK